MASSTGTRYKYLNKFSHARAQLDAWYFTMKRPAHSGIDIRQSSIQLFLILPPSARHDMASGHPDGSSLSQVCWRRHSHTGTHSRTHPHIHTHTHTHIHFISPPGHTHNRSILERDTTQPVPPGLFIHYRSYSRTWHYLLILIRASRVITARIIIRIMFWACPPLIRWEGLSWPLRVLWVIFWPGRVMLPFTFARLCYLRLYSVNPRFWSAIMLPIC